jgi:4a-hydroxytetrahydrobiopterin dehydratase
LKNQPLSEDAIRARAAEMPDWRVEGGRLRRSFEFDSFVDAFGWMAKVALVAEKLDHHPDWTNVYSRVEVELHSHDIGALSENDFRLAAAMTRLAAR